MRYKDNFCVACETCRNCGNKEDVWVYECDECGDVGYEEDFLEEVEGKELCRWCRYKLEEEE